MNSITTGKQVQSNWNTQATYIKVNADINDKWPTWKKEAYNEMFAVSAHANKVPISK